jgi:lantibiotic modifying enzyme
MIKPGPEVSGKAGEAQTTQDLSVVATRVDGINPADLTRQINTIQMQLFDLAKAKTEALAAARHVDLAALQPSINRLAKTK